MPSRRSMRSARSNRRALLAGVVFAAGLCSGADAGAAELAVKMQKEAFVPARSRVAAGTVVTWTNTDTVPHSVTADDKRFDSGAILSGKTFQWTADRAGALAYHCIFHPSMTAVLEIRPARRTPPRNDSSK